MKIDGKALYQLFKYSIYGLLTINLYVFFSQEILATRLEFPDGVAAGDFLQAYAATVDTAAWVILLLMFELETGVLEDRHFTRLVSWSLHMRQPLVSMRKSPWQIVRHSPISTPSTDSMAPRPWSITPGSPISDSLPGSTSSTPASGYSSYCY